MGEDASQYLDVVECVMCVLLRYSPVPGEGAQLVVGHRQPEPAAQRERAQPLLDGQLPPGPLDFRREEPVVERRVVGNEDSPLQHLEQLGCDLLETRRSRQPLAGQAVDMHRSRIHTGIDERMEPTLRTPCGIQGQRGHAQHASRVGLEAGGLDVDDRPGVVQFEHRLDGRGRHGGTSLLHVE